MAPSRTGIYFLKSMGLSDPSAVGGMFATDEGLNNPVKVTAERPPEVFRQRWSIQSDINTDSENLLYTIRTTVGPVDPVSPGWFYERPEKEAVITTNTSPCGFTFHEIVPDIYQIRLPTDIAAVDLCVGVNDNNEVVLQEFNKLTQPNERPHWQLLPAGAE